MGEQEIEIVWIDNIPEVQGEYRVGRFGVTRIEAYGEAGLHCDLPYLRVWKGDEKIAEFCKHNIVGVGYAPTQQQQETGNGERE